RTGRRVARSGERPRRAAAGHRTARPPVKKRAAKPHQARRNTHTGPRRPSRPGEPTALEREVIALTNDERENAGCRAVSVDGALQRAAQDYAADMARTGHFDHVGQDGSKPWDRARKAGYKGSFVSENIAMGGDSAVTPPKVVRMWMDSPGHAQNIKRCASTVTGVGRGTKGGRTYWVQMFG
ncbi:MAG TPA: CAP domain-containing protein, partial [Pilimelia sp.]|nr:CAP domain-containing protein [Pilimelia sp.]